MLKELYVYLYPRKNVATVWFISIMDSFMYCFITSTIENTGIRNKIFDLEKNIDIIFFFQNFFQFFLRATPGPSAIIYYSCSSLVKHLSLCRHCPLGCCFRSHPDRYSNFFSDPLFVLVLYGWYSFPFRLDLESFPEYQGIFCCYCCRVNRRVDMSLM